MTINVELLRRTLEYITEHPEQHDQSIWARIHVKESCGTAMCLCGWAATLAKAEMTWRAFKDYRTGEVVFRELERINGEEPYYGGRDLLGLTEDQAEDLFFDENSLALLWAMAELYTEGEIRMPRLVYEAELTRIAQAQDEPADFAWEEAGDRLYLPFPEGWQPAVAAEFPDAAQ